MSISTETRRVDMLEQQVDALRLDLVKLEVAIEALQKSNKDIQQNTKDMVDLLSGGRVATKIFLWVVGVVAGLGVILEFFGKK